MLNQLVTELAWEVTPAACSPRAPNRSKRSRVSLNDCGGGARPASSEGVLTNPPSPAVSWDEGEGEGDGGGGRDGDKRDEEDRSNEPSQGPQDGIGSSRSHQVRTRMRKASALCDHVGRGGGCKVDFAAAAVLV